jgi:hypothetical protein
MAPAEATCLERVMQILFGMTLLILMVVVLL